MTELLSNYLPIVIFIALSALIGGALLVAPFLVAVKRPDPEKVSAFEAGFDAFSDARMKVDVPFIWWRFSSSFSISKWPFSSPGPWPSAMWAGLVSGR